MPIRDWRELQDMNNSKQAGIANSFEELDYLAPEDDIQIGSDVPDDDERKRQEYNQRMEAYLAGVSPSQRMAEEEQTRQSGLQQLYETEEQINNDPKDYGYGDYRKDTRIPFDEWRKNPFDARANLQTPIAKLANGTAKMLPYAATTFLDDTVGLVAGILNVAGDALDFKDGFHPGRSFIQTPFAEKMQQVRDWSEKVLPNYRTEEEILDADNWWKHLNANFWGDTFMKNLGFTIGAGASAVLFGSGFRALEKGAARKAYRSAVAAATGDQAAARGFTNLLSGETLANPQKLNSILEEVSASAKKLGPIGQIVAGTSGAIGESRVEALQAAKEFRDAQNLKDNIAYNNLLGDLFGSLVEKGYVAGYDEDGNPILDEYGKQAFKEGEKSIAAQFAERQQMVDDQAYKLANTTFWLNMPLLTASNMIMFGKLFSGGYKTQSRAAIKGAVGNRRGATTIAGAVANSFKTPLSEGMEELTQKMISEGAKDVASANAAAFTNRGYDKSAIKGVSEWMTSMLNSAGEVLTNPQSWEEFAVGALTGAIGPGGRSRVGGMYANLKESLEQRKEDQELAKQINEKENSKEWLDTMSSIVRHVKLENIKDQALKENDKYTWRSADDEELLNAVMLYDKAGALDELEDLVDSFANLSEEELPQISQLLSDETKKDFNRRSRKQRLDWLHKQGEKVKNTIKEYRDAYDALDYLSFGAADEETIKELIYTKVQMKNFEDRYKSLFDDVIGRIRPAVEAVSKEVDAAGNPTKAAEQAQKLLSSEQEMKNRILNIRDKDNTIEVLKNWANFAGTDAEAADDIEDLQKLVQSRAEFYYKYFRPAEAKQFNEAFNEDKKQPEAVASEIEEDATQNAVDSIVEDLKSSSNRKEFFDKFTAALEDKDAAIQEGVEKQVRKDSKLKKYLEYTDKVQNFYQGLSNRIAELRKTVTDPDELAAIDDLAQMVENADAVQLASEIDDEKDPELSAASDLLNYLDKEMHPANGYYRKILLSYYKRIADAKKLGTIDPADYKPDTPAFDDIELSGKSRAGSPVSGKYTDKVDADGFHHISHEGDLPTQRTLSRAQMEAAGITTEELFGTDDDFENPADRKIFVDSFNEAEGNKSFKIKGATIKPNGEVSVMLDIPGVGDIEAEGTAADKLFALAFPEWSKSKEEQKDYDTVYDKIRKCLDVNDSELKAFAEGNFGSYNLTEEEKRDLQQEAINKLASLDDHAEDQDDNTGREQLNYQSDDKNTPEALAFKQVRAITLSGTPFSYYDIGSAKVGKKKKNSDPRTSATVNWMWNHNVPTFIDSGALAALWNHYKGNLPIYFVANPHNAHNNPNDNPFAYNNGIETLLAVEITDEDLGGVLSPYFGKSFDESKLIEIDGKRYQIIGQIDQPTEDAAKAAEKRGDTSVRRIKDNARLIWTDAIDRSIKPQHAADGGNSSTIIPETGKWYIAYSTNPEQKGDEEIDLKSGERLYTTLAYVQTGRNFTDPDVDSKNNITGYHKIPLRNSLEEYKALGKPYSFFLKTIEGVTTPGARITPPPVINCPLGSLWIATETANGKVSWNYVTVPSVAEYDFSVNEETPLVKDIYRYIAVALNAGDYTWQDRINAIKGLTDIFYTGRDNYIKVDFSKEHAVVVGGIVCESTDEVLDALAKKGFRFNVNATDVSEKRQIKMNKLIDAGVLRTEMKSFVRFNSNIGVNMVSDKLEDGTTVPIYPVSAPVPFTVYGREDVSSTALSRDSAGTYNIRLGDRSFSIDDEGVVRVMSKRNSVGKVVSDDKTIACVKALSELIGSIRNFSGKRYTVKVDGYMYNELYETQVGGYTVHMAREGKNNDIHIVYSDEMWDSLMKIAEPAGPRLITEEASGEPSPGKVVSDAAKFDAMRRKEGGVDETREGETTTIGGVDDILMGLDADAVDFEAPPTIQEASEKDESDESKIDCE